MGLRSWVLTRMFRKYWLTIELEDDSIHVVPMRDDITHEQSDECVCGPRNEAHAQPDGSVRFVVIHHSLDGRESREHA